MPPTRVVTIGLLAACASMRLTGVPSFVEHKAIRSDPGVYGINILSPGSKC